MWPCAPQGSPVAPLRERLEPSEILPHLAGSLRGAQPEELKEPKDRVFIRALGPFLDNFRTIFGPF